MIKNIVMRSNIISFHLLRQFHNLRSMSSQAPHKVNIGVLELQALTRHNRSFQKFQIRLMNMKDNLVQSALTLITITPISEANFQSIPLIAFPTVGCLSTRAPDNRANSFHFIIKSHLISSSRLILLWLIE